MQQCVFYFFFFIFIVPNMSSEYLNFGVEIQMLYLNLSSDYSTE